MANVTVIEFTKTAGIYRTGDRAGFSPALADEYVKRGFGSVVTRNVPAIDPKVVASDARRKVDEIRAVIVAAEREAQGVAKLPNAAATAADALEQVAAAKLQLVALERLIDASGDLGQGGDRRRPPASSAAA